MVGRKKKRLLWGVEIGGVGRKGGMILEARACVWSGGYGNRWGRKERRYDSRSKGLRLVWGVWKQMG